MAPDYIDFLIKRFESPDEVRIFEKGRFEIIKMGGITIGRATEAPRGRGLTACPKAAGPRGRGGQCRSARGPPSFRPSCGAPHAGGGPGRQAAGGLPMLFSSLFP